MALRSAGSGHLLDRRKSALDGCEVAGRQGAVDVGRRQPCDHFPGRGARMGQRLQLLQRQAIVRKVLAVHRHAHPQDEPASEAMRRELRVIVERRQQRVHAMAERAQLARLGVEHHEPGCRELGVDVDVEVEQRHDLGDARVDERVVRPQEQRPHSRPACAISASSWSG